MKDGFAKSISWGTCTFMAIAVLLSGGTTRADAPSADRVRHVVLIAGHKEHEPGGHENLRTVKLLKALLDQAPNLKNLETKIYFNGWPDDPGVLDQADTIVTFSEGEDGFGAPPVPFMTDERMQVMEKQMKRGSGFMTFHFSTFVAAKYAAKILDWGGGYFDWQGGNGEGGYFGNHGRHGTERWHSALSAFGEGVGSTRYEIDAASHPVAQGVKPFAMHGEYYYQIRFRNNDSRLTPLLRVPTASPAPEDQIVAWAVQRTDGGRGIGVTPGHFFASFQNDDFRKLILNAIAWTAGATVPAAGVQSRYLDESEVNRLLMKDPLPTLLVNAGNASGDRWGKTASIISTALNSEVPRFEVTVADRRQALARNLAKYKLIVLSNCDALTSDPNSQAEQGLFRYLNSGGGLLVVHSREEKTTTVNAAEQHARAQALKGQEMCKPLTWNRPDELERSKSFKKVDVIDRNHPISLGVSDRRSHIGETPAFRLLDDRAIRVIAALHEAPDQPVAFVVSHPHARIFEIAASDAEERQIENDVVSALNPTLSQLIHYGGLWAAGQR